MPEDQRRRSAPKILMISSQRTVTGTLTHLGLEQEGFDIILEVAPANAITRWAEVLPDLIILDINYPKAQTVQLVTALRAETPTPIMLITSALGEADLLEIYDAGADECLVKPVSPSIFLAKTRVWLRRSTTTPATAQDAVKVGSISLIPAQRTLTVGEGTPVRLTNLELRLLYFLMGRPRRAASTQELIGAVYGEGAGADAVMLKNLIYRLRRKIEDEGREVPLLQTVAGQGYMFVPQ